MDVKVENTPYIIRDIRLLDGKNSGSLDWKKSYFFFKRSLDFVFSLLVIVGVLSWLLPLLALLVKLDSRGPVLFIQTRIGQGGQPFSCLKLRTMVVNNNAHLLPASENDPRVTRMGKILRRSHLDELPQLFNVLFGSMSLVGPRPYMVADCKTFAALVPGHTLRNFVRPGITGLAQVKGYHGPATDFKAVFSRYQWDAFYVRNASFLLDIRILRRTILLFLTQQTPVCR